MKKVNPSSTDIVTLWDLPEDKVYLDLEAQTKEELFNLALQKSGTWNNLGRSLNLPINKHGNCKILESSRYKKMSLKILKLLLTYLEKWGIYLRRKIKKSVILLAPKRGSSRFKANCLFKPKLPFNFSTESGAIVVSALFHDGGINSRLNPHYSNPYDVFLRKKIYNAFKDVFGEFDFKLSDPYHNPQLYFPTIIGIILTHGLGIPHGRKVTNNPKVPDFIFRAPESVRSNYLQQAFDDEGSLDKKSRYITLKLASISKGPPSLLTGLKKLLDSLGIESRDLRFSEKYIDTKGISATKWTLAIHHQNNLLKFLDLIGFGSPQKSRNLKEIVYTIKVPHYSIKEKRGVLLEACKRTEERQGFITSAELAKELNRSQALAKLDIRKLRKEGEIKSIKKKIGNGSAHYTLVNQWLEKPHT
jgi:hypothetical protein